MAAAGEWTQDHDRFPTPASLREIVAEKRKKARDEQNSELLLAPSVPYSDEERAKVSKYLANTRRFLAGDITATEHLAETLRIYVSEPPYPSTQDALAAEAQFEKTCAELKDKPGALFRHLRHPGGAA